MESRCVPSHDLGSDELGLSPKPTDQRPKPKSLVCLLPASAIRPMVGFRQGRWRPDQIVPKRRNLELSRFPALFLEVPSLEEQGMNTLITKQCADAATLVALIGSA